VRISLRILGVIEENTIDSSNHINRQLLPYFRWLASPTQAWSSLMGPGRLRIPEDLDNRHVKVARLSAQHTGHLTPPGDNHGTHLFYMLSRYRGHSTAGRIKPMKNRTPDLPSCSAVSLPTAPPCTPLSLSLSSLSQTLRRWIFIGESRVHSYGSLCRIRSRHSRSGLCLGLGSSVFMCK
jgi:hypothetical protein